MAITFENIIYDRVIDSLNTLLSNEFSIPVRYDDYTLPQSFLLIPLDDSLGEYGKSFQTREYGVSIGYQLKIGGKYGRQNMKQVSSKAEQVKRLIFNNTSYAPSSSHKWHGANIASVEYETDEDDPSLLRALMTFNCIVTEVTS